MGTTLLASPIAGVAGQLGPQPGPPTQPSFLTVLVKTVSVVSATAKKPAKVVPPSTKLLPNAVCGTTLHLVSCWVRCALTLPEPPNSERMSLGYSELLPPYFAPETGKIENSPPPGHVTFGTAEGDDAPQMAVPGSTTTKPKVQWTSRLLASQDCTPNVLTIEYKDS